ncbi:MAG: hypothetical protein ACREOR_07725 [Candidatus Binatia bacterium]
MSHDLSKSGLPPDFPTLRHHRPASLVTAAWLAKLTKHLAILACFTIVGHATGRFEASQVAILLIVSSAALFHSVGRQLERRHSARLPRHQAGS